MSGATHPLPPHAFMAWCLVKAHYLSYICIIVEIMASWKWRGKI